MKKASFSEETKIELTDPLPKATCCRKSLAYGIFSGANVTCPENVYFETDSIVVLDLAKKLADELMGGAGQVCELVENRKKKYRMQILRKKAKQTLFNIRLSEENIEDAVGLKCPHCAAAFARGVFLYSGTITDPKSSYHLEISFDDEKMLEKVRKLLSDNGISTKRVERKKGVSLYCKDSASIEDFIAFIGANRAMFEIMNSKIEREIRNNSNRVANCEANNIAKSVSASGKHIAAIDKLVSMDRLSALPSELRETAELRMKFKDISLSELGAMMNPPISKSGINHRLNKIIEIADKM